MATTPSVRILVTGATGNVGAAVGAKLLTGPHRIRVADIDPARARGRFPGAEPVRLDFTDPATFGPALEGVSRLFLVRPPAIARVGPTLNRFLDAAVEAGVRHVVFSSVAGAENNRLVPHHRVERHLFASGLDWTVLRPGFFAQNLEAAYRADIREDDRIHVPAGDGRVAFVDTRDVGELAARILGDPTGHAGRAYSLTGPRALTFEEVAELLSGETGRPVRYEPATIPGYLRHLRARGLPLLQIVVQTSLHAGLRRGDAERVDPALAELLGRPPGAMEAYLHDHRDLWARPAPPARRGE